MTKIWFVIDYHGDQIGPGHLSRLEALAAILELREEGHYGLRIHLGYSRI